jgi:hypothetical protein
MTGLDALSMLGAADEINQVLQVVEEGHSTNRKEKLEYLL